MEIIKLDNIEKTYTMGVMKVHALKDINLVINEHEFVCIMGASGSGKSTLMNIIGCLDRPNTGDYFLNGSNVSKLSDNELAEVRNRRIGFVFQTFNLLPRISARRNVELPLIYSGYSASERRAKADEALERVGLSDRASHKPNELSGGQRQRVAIARALVNSPDIIFADEPTGNLDSKTGLSIMALFQNLHSEGATIVMVTHEMDIAMHGDRIIRLSDGSIQADEAIMNPSSALASLNSLPDTENSELSHVIDNHSRGRG